MDSILILLIIHFELGGWNLTDELTKRTNAIIKASKKKVDDYRYKRLYYKAVKLTRDDYEASLRNATKSLVKSALENEKKTAIFCERNSFRDLIALTCLHKRQSIVDMFPSTSLNKKRYLMISLIAITSSQNMLKV